MAVEAKKSENASVETPQLSELELLQAELAQMKKNYNVLNTNFKRAQTRNTHLEAQLDAAKVSKDAKESKRSEDSQAGSNAKPAVTESIEPSAKNTQEPVNPKEHLVGWLPKFCPECGTENSEFQDQVKCKNCGISLGSERYARHSMKACPNCGSTDFVTVPGYSAKHTEANGCTGPECKLQ